MLRLVATPNTLDPRLADLAIGDEFIWVGWLVENYYEYDVLLRTSDGRRFKVRRDVVSSDAFEELDMREYFPNSVADSNLL